MNSRRSNDLLETHGEDFKFLKSFGHDIKFTYDSHHDGKVKLKTVVPSSLKPEPREADLDLNSWAGTSFGAVHWYAKISLEYPNYVRQANGQPWGYGVHEDSDNPDLPFGVTHVEFEVMTRASKQHVKHDKDMRKMRDDDFLYGRMKLGDWTHGYFTEEEAKQSAIRFFKEHFGPGWRLVARSWVEDERPIYATT